MGFLHVNLTVLIIDMIFLTGSGRVNISQIGESLGAYMFLEFSNSVLANM